MPRRTIVKRTRPYATGLLVFCAVCLIAIEAISQNLANAPLPKYIFLFLSDGAGIPQIEITRQYNRHINNEGLVITDTIIKEGSLGLMTTHAADFLSTDSAAAATALASGCKAKVGALGVCADGSTPKTVGQTNVPCPMQYVPMLLSPVSAGVTVAVPVSAPVILTRPIVFPGFWTPW